MNLWFDLKYAGRLLKKSWGYSLMCTSVVALSVGLAVWIYTLAYSQVFKPLGFESSNWRSVHLVADAAARPRPGVDAYTYQELLKQNGTVDLLGAFASREVVLSEGQASTSVRGALFTPGLFAKTNARPLFGRIFEDADAQPGAPLVAVLSYSAWQDYFAGDHAVVGKTARIDSTPVQIIGVLPKEYFGFQDYELWMPLPRLQLVKPADSTMTVYPLIALRGGQSDEAAQRELQQAVARVNTDYPDLFKAARTTKLIPAHRIWTYNSTPIVTTLALMAAGILLLGCVNISMIFLAGLLERSRELALRTALGAARPRLLRQCLIETALIVFGGLLGGYALAYGGNQWTGSIGSFMSRVMASGRGSGNMPELRPVDVIVAIVIAVIVWLLSTLIPAWRISKQDAAIVLAGTGKGATVRGSNKTVGLLVGVQVVISCLVLVACGNVVLACYKEAHKPTGIESAHVTMSTYPTAFDSKYPNASDRLRYWDSLAAAVERKLPGAEVAFMTAAPTRPAKVPVAIETRQGGERDGALTLPHAVVSENYFDLLGIRLRSGRLFETTDTSGSLKVAVVDEQTAARYWPGQDVIGKRVQLNPRDNGDWLTIVGVVSSVGGRLWRTDEVGVLYQPLRQANPPQFQLLVKVPNAPPNHRVTLRTAAFEVDRDLPLHNLQTVDDYLAALNMNATSLIPVMSVVAIITAILAASGLFGLISRSVAQRTQEVGIRRALGATTWRATSMFRHQGAIYISVAVVGLGLGVMIMPLLSRAIPNILDSVITVTAGVVVLMISVIFTASYLPTRRAVALQPGDALRYD